MPAPIDSQGKAPNRYWGYVADEEGELITDLGDFNDLNPAITQACEYIVNQVTDDMMTQQVRIVDSVDQTTCWYAGPTRLLNTVDPSA